MKSVKNLKINLYMKNLFLIVFCFVSFSFLGQDIVQESKENTAIEVEISSAPQQDAKIISSTTDIKVEENVEDISEKNRKEDTIIASGNFTFASLWRGVLGMFSLILIAFLFSANRKAISWKRVAIGLSLQLVIAIGVLKVSFIQKAFELVGKLFIEILEYTKAGSSFLFAGLISDMDSFGYIFAFQVLPTIIFFSALTSLLFYLGIIQWMVKMLAIGLSKFLGISGMESLSVAGNIFLGQTEAPLLIKAYLEKMNKSWRIFSLIEKKIKTKLSKTKIPFWLGMLCGYVFDLFSILTKKKFSISSVRIKKFCATTQFNASKAHKTFSAPFTLQEGLNMTLEHEFIDKKEDEILFFSE